ncbi:MAG: hypothetical protein V4555_02270 [Acidobacteriota bacterium]
MPTPASHLRSIRIWLTLFIIGLALSGITAFPLVSETALLVRIATHFQLAQHAPALNDFFLRIHSALADTAFRYPFLAYGTDWLAFAHLVLAILFIGPWLDPVRNRWVITFGLIACAAVIPLAFIAGPIRHIPLYWRLIDSSFGLFGCIPLLIVRRHTTQLEHSLPTP